MSALHERVRALLLAAVCGSLAIVGAAGAVLVDAIGCSPTQPPGYPTPAAAASYDLAVTDCAVTGSSRAAIDECRAEKAATYCANYSAMAMCPKDGGADR